MVANSRNFAEIELNEAINVPNDCIGRSADKLGILSVKAVKDNFMVAFSKFYTRKNPHDPSSSKVQDISTFNKDVIEEAARCILISVDQQENVQISRAIDSSLSVILKCHIGTGGLEFVQT